MKPQPDPPPAGNDAAPPRLWARITPLLPYLATLALFAAGLGALHHLLREVAADEVARQIGQVPRSHLIAALAATVIGYGAMACYDWTALRYIGRHLPARMVALGGFLAYSIGNTVGISALSGGAVRYRVYAVLGLGLGDIARISGFVALAYGTGATLVGLGALILWPDALGVLLPLPEWLVRVLAAAGFLLGNLAIWGAGLRRGRLRLGRWSIDAPAPGLMATQLLITLTEMLMGALVLHLLLIGAELPFLPFLALYLAATMAGILSHVPGGVGVFETLIIAALPASVPVADAAAALLLYRLIYYILPFLLALVLLAGLEARDWLTGRVTAYARALTLGLVPVAMGALVMASGVVMMLAPLLPRGAGLVADAEAALPPMPDGAGALVSTLLGAVLVLIAQGLLRRLAGAWWLTMIVLAAGVLVAVLDGFHTERALVLALAALLLLPCRGAFYRSTRLTTGALSADWLLLVGGMLVSVMLVLFLAGQAAPPLSVPSDALPEAPSGALPGAVDPGPAATAWLRGALRPGLVGGGILVLISVWQALRRATRPTGEDRTATRDRVKAILARWGGPADMLALQPGRRWLLAETGDAVIAYVEQGRSWIAHGDPIGDPARIPALIWGFRDAARRARMIPVFYAASARWFPQWIETGMTLYRMGEEAVIDPSAFSPDKGRFAQLRADHGDGLQAGLQFQLLDGDAARAALAGPDAVPAWLDAGAFRDPAALAGAGRFSLALVRHRGRIAGCAVVLGDGRGQAAVIDWLGHDPQTDLPVRSFLLVSLVRALAARGVVRLGLGVAPLARLDGAPDLAGRIGRLIHRSTGRGEGFDAARRFREDFAPQWQMRYLVLPRLASPASVLGDLARLLTVPQRRPAGPPVEERGQG